MILESFPQILEIRTHRLPAFLFDALEYMVSMRFGKGGDPAADWQIPARQLGPAFVGMRFGLEIVMYAAVLLDWEGFVQMIYEADQVPPAAQQENAEFRIRETLPGYLTSYQQALTFNDEIYSATRKDSVHLGLQFGLWTLELFEAYNPLADLLSEQEDLAYQGRHTLKVGLGEQGQIQYWIDGERQPDLETAADS